MYTTTTDDIDHHGSKQKVRVRKTEYLSKRNIKDYAATT